MFVYGHLSRVAWRGKGRVECEDDDENKVMSEHEHEQNSTTGRGVANQIEERDTNNNSEEQVNEHNLTTQLDNTNANINIAVESKEEQSEKKKIKISPEKKGMNVLSMIKVMNNETIDAKSKEHLMGIIKTSSKEEDFEVSEMAPTCDRKCMLTEYILKAKRNKLEARRRRNEKFAICKRRLEGLGIQI